MASKKGPAAKKSAAKTATPENPAKNETAEDTGPTETVIPDEQPVNVRAAKAALNADDDIGEIDLPDSKPAKAAGAGKSKKQLFKITAEQDLRVIIPGTGNAVLFEAGVTRTLNETIAFAAQSAGAEQKIVVQLENA
jgi:hypothetical protein